MRFDKHFFSKQFDLYFIDLIRFVDSYVGDIDVARDIVHDVFLQLWNDRSRIDISYSIKTYLFTLARNKALNYLKHQKVVRDHEEDLILHLLAEGKRCIDADFEERVTRVKNALELLPNKQREVVVMFFFEGLNYATISDQLVISVSTVKTHLSRAVETLRIKVKEDLIFLLSFSRIK